MVTMMVLFFSGEFIGLYGNNDGIYSFQENSLVYMVTMMVLFFSGEFIGMVTMMVYIFQENSSVYMVIMMVYILFRRISRFIW